MKKLQARHYVLIACLALPHTVSCATRGGTQNVEHALYLCRQLSGQDARKGEGEVWFGLQTERAKTSRKLWNQRGVKAIDKQLSVGANNTDRACLMRLKKEAQTRQIANE